MGGSLRRQIINIECAKGRKYFVGELMNFKLFYLRVKLEIEAKLVVEGFDEKRGAMEVLARLKQ